MKVNAGMSKKTKKMFMIAEPRGRRVFIQDDKHMVRTRLDHPPTRGSVIVPIDALHQQLPIRSLLLQVHHIPAWRSMAQWSQWSSGDCRDAGLLLKVDSSKPAGSGSRRIDSGPPCGRCDHAGALRLPARL